MLDSRIGRFFEGLAGKQIWFVGIGVAHTPTIRMFAERRLMVTACDRRSREQLGEALCAELEKSGVRLLLGEDYPQDFAGADVLFRTPGMYYHRPELQHYRTHGGVLTGEMEVFCDLCPCPLYAVTGSDGKTTTTSLIAEMLGAYGTSVHMGGNIGRALLPDLPGVQPQDLAVVELSSFQLIAMHPAPAVSVVTNVTPNHLDVHASMEEYTATKRQVFAHQNAFSRTVLCADDPITLSFAPDVRGECMLFSMRHPVENGAWYDAHEGNLYIARHGQQPRLLMQASELRIPGMHNVANLLAAVCAVQDRVDDETIRQVARTFAGVEHRIEFVRELDGVRWYNDSIATSPTRVIAGLRAFDQRLIIIGGGYDKNIPFEPMAGDVVERVKTLILCGITADKIEAAVRAHPDWTPETPRIIRCKDIPEAVCIARKIAVPGDIVSLSPACASYDNYSTFEERGRHFKKLVHAL